MFEFISQTGIQYVNFPGNMLVELGDVFLFKGLPANIVDGSTNLFREEPCDVLMDFSS